MIAGRIALVSAVAAALAWGPAQAQSLIPDPPRAPGFAQAYRWLHFSSNGTGYAVSEAALIRTRDDGVSWQALIEMQRDGGGMIVDAFFLDASTFFILRAPDQLLATTDGGDSFASLSATVPAIDDPNATDALRGGFYFVDAQNGWGLGTRQFLRTLDGGQTWGRVRMRVAPPRQLWIFDLQSGIAIGGRLVSTTNDGGTTWEAVAGTPQLDWVRCASGGSPCVGVSATKADYAVAYVSTNRGQTWQQTNTGLVWGPDRIEDLQITAGGGAAIMGQGGRRSIQELRSFVGSGTPIPEPSGTRAFMVTWDGSSWQRHDYPEIEEGFRTAHFVSASEVWASAGENGLVKSIDGGETWTFVPDYFHQAAALTPSPTPFPTPPAGP
jgi:photosystem II stability/assembly factor-like uncharacterized protein